MSSSNNINVLNNKILKWHGAPNAIDGIITVNHNKNVNDFGNGFYCNSLRSMANDYALRGDVPELYEVEFPILTDYRVYSFSSMKLWLLYICYNRKLLDDIPRNIIDILESINQSYDLIIGPIADDNVTIQLPKFVKEELCYEVIMKQLMVANLGSQWVIKSQKLLNNCKIKQIDLISRNRFTREGLQQEIKDIEERYFGIKTYITDIIISLVKPIWSE